MYLLKTPIVPSAVATEAIGAEDSFSSIFLGRLTASGRYCLPLSGRFVVLMWLNATLVLAGEADERPVEAPSGTRTREELGLVLSKETTFLVEPLTQDGYVDYVAALNEQ